MRLGISEANNICRDTEVPYGKIYIVFESLAGKGFVEIQSSRFKNFRAVDPNFALDYFFEKRNFEFQREMKILKIFCRRSKTGFEICAGSEAKR